MKDERIIVAAAVLGFVLVVSILLWVFISFWLGLLVFFSVTTVLVINAIQNIPANPPHKGILIFLGKRQETVLDEGWNFVPLYPLIFSFVSVKVEKVNYNLEPQRVRTPDRAEISVSPSITWIAGIKDEPKSYIAYLNSGGEDGVKRIIKDIIEDRVKTWAGSNKEGPSNWMEALALRDDAHEVLSKRLLALPRINSGVPTNTWMRFFESPQSEPTDYDANPSYGWAEKKVNQDGVVESWNWNGLKAIFDGLSESDQSNLKEEIKQRREIVRKLREGRGEFGVGSLGITVYQFTINEIKVEGDVAKAAEMEEKERRERAADKMEMENVSDRVTRLRADHPDMTIEQAIDLVQTERGKVGKNIIAVKGAQTGLGQDLLAAVGLRGAPTSTAISGQGNRGSDSDNTGSSRGRRGRSGGQGKNYEDMTRAERQAEYDRMMGEDQEKPKG